MTAPNLDHLEVKEGGVGERATGDAHEVQQSIGRHVGEVYQEATDVPRTPVLSRKVGSATRGTAGHGAQLAESIRSAASGTEPGELDGQRKGQGAARAERLRTERLLSDMDATVGADLTAANQPGDMYDSAEPLVTEGADDSVRAELQERLAAD